MTPGVTLESLYLDPLDELVQGRAGSVYPGWDGEFQLLVDIKSDAEQTWAAIEAELEEHRTMLSRVSNGKVKQGAVSVVISGNRPLATRAADQQRVSFYDGRATDLGSAFPSSLMPLISNNWNQLFTWQGVGELAAAERAAVVVRLGRLRRDRDDARVVRAVAGNGRVRNLLPYLRIGLPPTW